MYMTTTSENRGHKFERGGTLEALKAEKRREKWYNYKHELKKDTSNGHFKVNEEKPQDAQLYYQSL